MSKQSNPARIARVQLFAAVTLSLCSAGLFTVAALAGETSPVAVGGGAGLAAAAVLAWLQYGRARKGLR